MIKTLWPYLDTATSDAIRVNVDPILEVGFVQFRTFARNLLVFRLCTKLRSRVKRGPDACSRETSMFPKNLAICDCQRMCGLSIR